MNEFEVYAQGVLDELEKETVQNKEEDEEDLEKWSDLEKNEELTDPEIGEPQENQIGSGGNLPDEDKEAIGGGIGRKGVEALAFYKSYRFKDRGPCRGRWGIFVFDWALDYLRDDLLAHHPSMTLWHAREWGWKKIEIHELYHFKTDGWTFAQESSIGKPLYETYLDKVYRRYAPGLEVVEESLANRSVYWRSLGKHTLAPVKDWVIDFMLGQPGAYAKFKMSTAEHLKAKATLAAQIVNGKSWKKGMALDALAYWLNEGNNRIVKPELCPKWIIYGVSVWALPSLHLPNIKEVEAFLYKYLGAEPVPTTDHPKVRLDNDEIAKIPNPHSGLDRLKPHEFKNLLRKAGMRTKDYFQARKETRIWKRNVPRSPTLPAIA